MKSFFSVEFKDCIIETDSTKYPQLMYHLNNIEEYKFTYTKYFANDTIRLLKDITGWKAENLSPSKTGIIPNIFVPNKTLYLLDLTIMTSFSKAFLINIIEIKGKDNLVLAMGAERDIIRFEQAFKSYNLPFYGPGLPPKI